MPINNTVEYPPLAARLYSVWFRHFRVYTKHLLSNGLPPFLEPLIFLAGIGIGMGKYVENMAGMPYLTYLATGLPITAAMFTAAFECSFGTFIRLEFDHIYDGMLAAPLTVEDCLIGEILWAGSKGVFFSFAVIIVVGAFGLIPLPWSLMTPIIGFFTGIMFASLSLLVTSIVSNINQFNFYFTGFLSPMFFFAGVVFPIENLPKALQPFAEVFPLTHVVRLCRAADFADFKVSLLFDCLFIVIFTLVTAWIGIARLKKKIMV